MLLHWPRLAAGVVNDGATTVAIALVLVATGACPAQERQNAEPSAPLPLLRVEGIIDLERLAPQARKRNAAVQPDVRFRLPNHFVEAITVVDDEDDDAPRGTIQLASVEAFNLNVFGFTGAKDVDRTVDRWRLNFRQLLSLRVERDVETHHLNPDQREKLLIAGAGDIKRFFDWIDANRKAVEAVSWDFNKAWHVIQEVKESVSVTRWAGPFTAGSLYSKVLNKFDHDRNTDAATAVVPRS